MIIEKILQDSVNRIEKEGIISIIRLKQQSMVSGVVENLIAGGIGLLEITSNTPGYEEEIENARQRHPSALIGAGTILNAALAKKSIDAGAQFLVSPNCSGDIIKIAHNANVPVIMGALTPSEIYNAITFGADFVKLFPAGSLGINYYKSVKAPFLKTKFFAVGGIGFDNIEDWLATGITGVGIGGSLVNNDIAGSNELNNLKEQAARFIALKKAYGSPHY